MFWILCALNKLETCHVEKVLHSWDTTNRDTLDDMFLLDETFQVLEAVALPSAIVQLAELHSECWRIQRHRCKYQEHQCSFHMEGSKHRLEEHLDI